MRAKFNYLYALLSARACKLYNTFFKVLNNAIFDLLGFILEVFDGLNKAIYALFSFIIIALALVLKAILLFAYVSLPLFAILGLWALILKLLS